jgi:hypothetical protein
VFLTRRDVEQHGSERGVRRRRVGERGGPKVRDRMPTFCYCPVSFWSCSRSCVPAYATSYRSTSSTFYFLSVLSCLLLYLGSLFSFFASLLLIYLLISYVFVLYLSFSSLLFFFHLIRSLLSLVLLLLLLFLPSSDWAQAITRVAYVRCVSSSHPDYPTEAARGFPQSL